MPSAIVPWESGCGPADPAISSAQANYTGSGYAPSRRTQGEVGTINAGLNTPVPPAGFPAQVRWFIGADGQLHALTNQTAQDFTSTTSTSPQEPPVYSPTR